MKKCTACGKRQKIAEFREDCGEFGVIENFMCRTCMRKAERISRQNLNSGKLIQQIAKKVLK